MFQVPEGFALKEQMDTAEKNYIIQRYDQLEAEVFTNKGEKIIDPDFRSGDTNQNGQSTQTVTPSYEIDVNGIAKFPMIGEAKLEGLTIRQAEEVLQQAYSKFYTDAYVVLRYTNKRVIVLGAPGGQVIPLTNENMYLVEVLALAKGLSNDAKSQNIRILRGDQVYVADLSTFDGYVKNNIPIQSGDIVYVEPIRRPFTEGVRDYGPILSIITTLTTLIVVIVSL
jgi:polysaccharide biosynthesis/export protein